MKKHTVGSHILMWGFALLLLFSFPLYALLIEHLDTTNYENRELVEFNDLADLPLAEFPMVFEDWLSDNAPFRNEMMALNAAINRSLNTLDSSDVLLGKEDWLFLKDVSDSKSLSDYQGLTAYSEEEQASFVKAVENLQGVLAAQGTELVILFAPAKEGIYSEFMPDYIPVVGEQTKVDSLVDTLAQNTDVPIVYPKDRLIEAAKDVPVYYKYDTHWNNVGAYIAADEVFTVLGFKHTSTLPEISVDDSVSPPQDLANVSAYYNYTDDDRYYEVETAVATIDYMSDNGYVTHYRGEGEGDLLFVRDSFGEMLAPYLAAPFEKSVSIHGNALDVETLSVELPRPADYVVVEVAERFSDTLISKLNVLTEFHLTPDNP